MKQLQKAFTIIEILFVIAIIGVMASLGVALMQHRAQEAKIQKSALQIQQLLQAGMAYYADNSAWPTLGTPQAGLPDFNKYLPANADEFPWGHKYIVQPDATKPKLLDVETPGIDKKIADRVAALLPNAKVIPNGVDTYSVLAQTTQPEKGGGSDTTIETIGSALFGDKQGAIPFDSDGTAQFKIDNLPTCPANESMQVLIIPSHIQMLPGDQVAGALSPPFPNGLLDNLTTSSLCSDGSCTISVKLQTRLTCKTAPEKGASELDISYITYCKKQ